MISIFDWLSISAGIVLLGWSAMDWFDETMDAWRDAGLHWFVQREIRHRNDWQDRWER